MKLSFAILLTLFSSVLAHPVSDPDPPTLVSQVLKRAGVTFSSCTVPNKVALTFDDGPYAYMMEIGDTLTNAGAKGTFFINGDNWGCVYDYQQHIKYVYAQGHQLGSHTWRHADLTTLTWDEINNEMYLVELALQRIIGVQPAWMRPPYGSLNQMVVDAANTRGQNIALWDLDAGDADNLPPSESKSRYQDIVNQHPSNILALNHETYSTTAHDVLPFAINLLKNAGYDLVTLAECVDQNPYQSVGAPQTPTPDWHC